MPLRYAPRSWARRATASSAEHSSRRHGCASGAAGALGPATSDISSTPVAGASASRCAAGGAAGRAATGATAARPRGRAGRFDLGSQLTNASQTGS